VADAAGSTDTLAHERSPVIVELLGLPGAGKSTLAAALLGTDQRGTDQRVTGRRGTGRRVAGRRGTARLSAPDHVLGSSRLPLPEAVGPVLRAAVGQLPGRARDVARRALLRADDTDALAVLARSHPAFLDLIAHAPPPHGADAAQVLVWRGWPLTTLRMHVALRRSVAPGRTVLVEEGVVQRANTVCAGAPELAPAYFASQPLPDALIVLHIDAEAAMARISGRGGRALLRHEGRTSAEVLADLQRTAQLVTTAVDALRARGLPVIELDATAPTGRQRHQVLAAVAALQGRQRP